MGFRNLLSYAQRFMDRTFKIFRYFYRVFINDIVIFSDSFKEYVAYLKQVFFLFESKGILFSPEKLFIGF